jgi:glycosyltransferase involved in cell wall biosynthesis
VRAGASYQHVVAPGLQTVKHMSHFFSIIIPTYNRAEKLRRAIASVEQQTFKDFELIVCDDGSTDNTKEVVDSFAGSMKVTYLWESNWGGPARPRNNGIRAARGEWICFLDADDWWYPGKLASVYENVTAADVVYHDGDIHTAAGKKLLVKMSSRRLKTPAFIDMMTKGNPFINSGVCIRRGILETTGGFSEDRALISVEDFDLGLRISLITERFVHIPSSLCAYWTGEGNISGSPRHISAHAVLLETHKDRLTPQYRLESERYFSYCIGLALLNGGSYRQSREQFLRSLRSRNVRMVVLSLMRIAMSFLHQLFD